jgi:hypothetical protein
MPDRKPTHDLVLVSGPLLAFFLLACVALYSPSATRTEGMLVWVHRMLVRIGWERDSPFDHVRD